MKPSACHRFTLPLLPLLGALCVASPALGAEPVQAPPPQAEAQQADALFRAASAAFEQKDYRAAATGFDAAYEVAPHPVARFNAAKAWELGGERARAANRWAEVVDAAELDAPSRETARSHLGELDRVLGRLRVEGSADTRARVSGFASGPLPWDVRLEPGRHTVSVERAGGRVERSVTLGAGDVLALDTTGLVPAPAAPAPDPDAADLGPAATDTAPMLWTGVTSFVLAGVAVGVGAGVGAAALGSRDDYEASGRFDLDARDRAALERDASTGLFVTAGVLAAVGLVLVVVSEVDSAPSVTSALVFP